jgi:biopolymer transport protein ExbB
MDIGGIWGEMGIFAKLVVLGLMAMVVALPVLAVKLARHGRGLRGLAAIAVSAPLVGALGTVIGLINASAYVAHQEHVPASQIAAGVGEALVTTAIGLAIAIVAIWLRVGFEPKAVRTEPAAEPEAAASLS